MAAGDATFPRHTVLEIINDFEALVRQVEQQFPTPSIAEKHSLKALVRQVEQHFATASIAEKHSLLHECEVMFRDCVIIEEDFRDTESASNMLAIRASITDQVAHMEESAGFSPGPFSVVLRHATLPVLIIIICVRLLLCERVR